MAQLTGNFQGTAAADTFSGSDTQTVVKGVATGIAVKQVIIDTFAGDDSIEAKTNFFAPPPLTATAIGMTNADINTGSGADKVNILSNSSSISANITTGLQNSFIETDADNDIISVNSALRTTTSGTDTGIRLATLSAGAGNDTLQVNSSAVGSVAEGRIKVTDIGIDQSTLLGDAGQDSITLKSEAIGASENGGDVVSTGAAGESSIQGGADGDSITISATANSGTSISTPGTATAKGISGGTIVEGGEGNDVIDISAKSFARVSFTANGSNTTGGAAQSYGAADAFVYGGAGQDTLKFSSSAESVRNSPSTLSYGIFNSTVDGGSEADIIEIKAFGSPTTSGAVTGTTHHGAVNSTLYGGIGSDTIDISVAQAENAKASVGALNSTLDAGDDNDTVKVRGSKLDIQDSLIMGGGGDDIFDTGIGSGTVLGGSGTDLFKLDFFNADTMTIEQQGADGLKIMGTQDKTGATISWSQDIFEVESYEVAGTVYDAAGVVSLLG